MCLVKTGLPFFASNAVEEEEEKAAFYTFLKNLDMSNSELDDLVVATYDDYSGQIDCSTCPKRALQSQPLLSDEDIAKFAEELHISPSILRANYLVPLEDRPGEYDFKCQPCPFFANNLCTNHLARPRNCAVMCHNTNDADTPIWESIFNYELCPVVALVYKALKLELWDAAEEMVGRPLFN